MPTRTGEKNKFILTQHSMKMENPNKQNARNTSNTLKQLLQDEAYLRALEIVERSERFAYKNRCYGDNED